jgi:regulatory protein
MTVRLEDPEARLQHARDVAWKALNRRERTVAELARLLAAKRVEPAAIETVLAELLEQGYLDDASYAQRFADDRRRLDAWGAERIERKLLSLGIDRELIAAAVGEQDHAGEIEAALELLARRFPDPPQTPRDRDRALGMLVRKGYELELAYDALRRHCGARAESFD